MLRKATVLISLLAVALSLQAAGNVPVYLDRTQPAEVRAADLVDRMTLEEKIDMLSGYNDFFLHPVERLGIPAFKMADGPLGVASWGLFGRATAFPSTMSLASSWDRDLAGRTGRAFADEWRSRGIHIMLAPGVNIYRASRGARNFEYFGEDPYLTGQIAGAFTKSVQSGGVMPVVKHFVGNDQEFDRYRVSTEADIRTLREIYMLPFEQLITRDSVMAIMSGYNLINGVHCSESALLDSMLHKVWHFDGVHMSDWGATESTLGAMRHGVDLEMGSNYYLMPDKLLPLLESGEISEAMIDEKVRNIFTPCFRMGFFDRPQTLESLTVYDPARFEAALDGAREGIILLANRGAMLPLDPDKVKTIAVVGPTANPSEISDRVYRNDGIVYGGGGSSKVNPWRVVNDLEGIAAAFPGARVLYAEGVPSRFKRNAFSSSKYMTPDGKNGLRAAYYASEGDNEPVLVRTENRIDNEWGEYPRDVEGLTDTYRVEWTGRIVPETTDTLILFADTQGACRVWLDGKLVVDGSNSCSFFFGQAEVAVESGKPVDIKVEYANRRSAPAEIRVGYANRGDVDFSEAEKIARMADAVICCIGMDGSIEFEGRDRPFELPYGQDELIARMMRIKPEATAVVVHGGGGMDMSRWADTVPAILHAIYPGQEGGTALGEIIAGKVNPSAKLPFTIERHIADSPSYGNYDETRSERKIYYREGLFTGYRGYDRSGVKPLFAFGHGLSYTDFAYSDMKVVDVDRKAKTAVIELTVTNTGKRAGAEVVQVYVTDDKASVERPEKELKQFDRVVLEPGESKRVRIELGPEAFRFYDVNSGDWKVEPGTFTISAGPSSDNLPLRASLKL